MTPEATSIESTCSATVEVITRDGRRSVLTRATYRDVIVQHDGDWLIARREVLVPPMGG